jgi:hypothetical protein
LNFWPFDQYCVQAIAAADSSVLQTRPKRTSTIWKNEPEIEGFCHARDVQSVNVIHNGLQWIVSDRKA